jgi:exonuclease I
LGDERISNVKSNIKWLEKHYKRLEDLMIHEQERDYDDIENIDIDASIYTQGLFNSEELSMINIFHSLGINQKLAYINNLENQRIKDLGLRIIFRNYPEQLDDTNQGLIIASIVDSNAVNFKKEKRRMPQDAIDEANGIIDNEDITQEQVTIINDYLNYLQSVKA